MEDFDIRQQQLNSDKELDNALRPLTFDDFAGQGKIVENLRVFVQAARQRGESLDHTLLHGPPGLGKTTLSNIIANELAEGKVTLKNMESGEQSLINANELAAAIK